MFLIDYNCSTFFTSKIIFISKPIFTYNYLIRYLFIILLTNSPFYSIQSSHTKAHSHSICRWALAQTRKQTHSVFVHFSVVQSLSSLLPPGSAITISSLPLQNSAWDADHVPVFTSSNSLIKQFSCLHLMLYSCRLHKAGHWTLHLYTLLQVVTVYCDIKSDCLITNCTLCSGLFLSKQHICLK